MDEELRRVLARIEKQTTETNGRVSRLEEEVFGLSDHQTDGLIAQVVRNTKFREQQEVVGRLIKFVVTPSAVLTTFGMLLQLAN